MSFRKERKFRLTQYDARAMESELINRGMTQLFPARTIASQYFDASDLKAFHDSEEGSLPRKKIRVRWYNGDQTGLAWEEKVSSVEGRFKTFRPISIQAFETVCADGHLDNLYGHVRPSVTIQYKRKYYSLDGHRITFDSEIEYFDSRSVKQTRDFQEVVEIKAPFETKEDVLEGIISTPSSRFSKYARAFLSFEESL